MKVAIVDLKGKYAAALTENGEVRRIRNNSYEIGQEIELYDIREIKQPRIVPRVIRRVAAAAAAIVILAVGGIGTAYAIPAGTVVLESDPSIEYTINCFDYVLDVKALNDDGEAVLDEIDPNDLRHHKIDDAVTTTVEQIEKDGRFDTDNAGVKITADTGDSGHTDRLQQSLDAKVHGDMGLPEKAGQTQQPEQIDDPAANHEGISDQQSYSQQQNDSAQQNAPQENSPQSLGGNQPEDHQNDDDRQNAPASSASDDPLSGTGAVVRPI